MDGFGTIKNSFFLRELRKFIRVETCLVVSCITLSGYLIFNTYSSGLFFLLLAMFFGCGASYGYNQLTDKKEDAVNNKRLNIFVTSKWGNYVIMVCASIGLLSALTLPLISLLVYLTCMLAGFAYSFFRIKRFFLLKNLYSGIFIASSFLIGSTAGSELVARMIPYFLLMLLIGFTSNLIGDVRGYRGDVMAGLRTIPIVIGISMSKKIIHVSMVFFSLTSVLLGYVFLIPMIPSLAATSVYLEKDHHKTARSCIISSFPIMIIVMVLVRMING